MNSKEIYKQYLSKLREEQTKSNEPRTLNQKMILKLFKEGRSKLGISKDLGITRAYVYEYLTKQGLHKKG